MTVNAKVFFLIILACVLTNNKSRALEIDYLGDYLTDEEYKSRKICSTKVCIEDNDRLIYAATRNSSIKPCDDIKTFAMGEFLKHRVVNERYDSVGFENERVLTMRERTRIILNEPFKDDDPRMFKAIKSFYKKCVNSDLVRKNGANDMISYLEKLGGAPLISNGTWNNKDFEVKNLFKFDPFHALQIFLDQKIDRCKDPRNPKVDRLCFKESRRWHKSKTVHLENDTLVILRSLDIEKSIKLEAIKDILDNLHAREKLPMRLIPAEVFTVKDLYLKYPELNIEWLHVINSQLLKHSQISYEDEVVVENPELMKNLLKLLAGMESGKIANVFATNMFYYLRNVFNVYTLTRYYAIRRGTKQSEQRFQNCIHFLEDNMRFGLEVLLKEKYFDPSLQAVGKELIKEAVSDVVDEIKKQKDISEEAKTNLVNKIESIKIAAMFPDDILNTTKIQGMYEELTIDGSESLADMYLAMENHIRKLFNEKPTEWIKDLQETLSWRSRYTPYYYEAKNVMCFPWHSFLYPQFHPDRSRFFNTATLYSLTVKRLVQGINRDLKKETNKTLKISHLKLADDNYVRWEANGGEERQLSSFKLTNRQMLWICLTYVNTSKYHKKTTRARANFDYKNDKQFRDAFMCESRKKAELSQ